MQDNYTLHQVCANKADIIWYKHLNSVLAQDSHLCTVLENLKPLVLAELEFQGWLTGYRKQATYYRLMHHIVPTGLFLAEKSVYRVPTILSEHISALKEWEIWANRPVQGQQGKEERLWTNMGWSHRLTFQTLRQWDIPILNSNTHSLQEYFWTSERPDIPLSNQYFLTTKPHLPNG